VHPAPIGAATARVERIIAPFHGTIESTGPTGSLYTRQNAPGVSSGGISPVQAAENTRGSLTERLDCQDDVEVGPRLLAGGLFALIAD
jgi:hypothetical protein